MMTTPLEEAVLLCVVQHLCGSLYVDDSFTTKHESSNCHDKYAVAIVIISRESK